MHNLVDMMGREVNFHFPPQRIVSLVPSQTEFLIDIGAPIIGRTKFCIHPKGRVDQIPIIGGTKNFRLDVIRQLKPDLIIGNKEENYEEGIAVLEKEYPVWMSDIKTLDDAYAMMRSIGAMCDKEQESNQLIAACQQSMSEVKNSRSGKVIYLIWKNPWMVAGRNTFIDYVLNHLGYENAVKEERYPQLSTNQLKALDPEYILFSSEPYPFKEKHLIEANAIWPKAECKLVDGELFSWYGSRLKYFS